MSYYYVNDEHLKRVTSGSNAYDLFYDALGRCVKRVLNGATTYYIYDGEKPILEYRSTDLSHPAKNVYGKGIDEILMRYDPSFNPAVTYYYQQDHEGSVTHLLNTSGNVIESYKYDAFGAPAIYEPDGVTLRSASIVSNRFLFTGREYSALFGFYEYRARAYHPTLGRFMSEDPKLFDAGDYNLFRYCHNDPIDFTDPMGLDIRGTVTYDYDGDPHAYAVPGSGHIGHDHLGNAMSNGHLSRNVVAFRNGKPIERDGYYVSKTSWQKHGRSVNAYRVPYIALGTEQQKGEGAVGGRSIRAWFRIENPGNGRSINVVFADSRGGNNEGIEISRAAARAIDLRSGDLARAVFLGNFRTGFPIDDAIKKGTKKTQEISSEHLHGQERNVQ